MDMTKPPRPAPLRERDITRHIAREYYKEFDQLIEMAHITLLQERVLQH